MTPCMLKLKRYIRQQEATISLVITARERVMIVFVAKLNKATISLRGTQCY